MSCFHFLIHFLFIFKVCQITLMAFTSFFNQLLQLPCSLMGVCKFVVDDWGRVLQEALLAFLKNKLGVELNFHHRLKAPCTWNLESSL